MVLAKENPILPRAAIWNFYVQIFFQIELTGIANYVNSEGKTSVDKFGPELKTDDAKSKKTRFDFLLPNTNYTAKLCAVTRRKECGEVIIKISHLFLTILPCFYACRKH